MNEQQFIDNMKKHDLSLTQLMMLYDQYLNFNYMSRTEIEAQLTLSDK